MGYDLNRLRKEFAEVCEKAGVKVTIPVNINGRLTRTLGRVKAVVTAATGECTATQMEFSKQLLETSTDKSIRDVLLHETAHYIAIMRSGEGHGHDSYFKAICAEIGATHDGVFINVDRTVEVKDKYDVFCDTCNLKVAGYSRMCKTIQRIDKCTCNKCNTSNLRVVQNW